MCLKKKIDYHQNHKICRVNLLCNNILYFALFAIDFFCRFGYNSLRQFAGVMELADVLDSKSSGSDTVRVRPPPPAPKNQHLRQEVLVFAYLKRSDGQTQLVPARLYGFLRFRLRLGENGAHIRHAFAERERDGLAVVGEPVDFAALALVQQIGEQES